MGRVKEAREWTSHSVKATGWYYEFECSRRRTEEWTLKPGPVIARVCGFGIPRLGKREKSPVKAQLVMTLEEGAPERER